MSHAHSVFDHQKSALAVRIFLKTPAAKAGGLKIDYRKSFIPYDRYPEAEDPFIRAKVCHYREAVHLKTHVVYTVLLPCLLRASDHDIVSVKLRLLHGQIPDRKSQSEHGLVHIALADDLGDLRKLADIVIVMEQNLRFRLRVLCFLVMVV